MENISGTTHALEASYDGGTTWDEVKGVDNLEFDTTDESLNRPFIDGTALDIQTQFKVAMTCRITYLNQENLDKILGAYMYEANEALDSNPDIAVGSTGGLKLGLARTVQPEAHIRLRPRIAAQADKTINYVNATIALGEPNFEDGLIATSARISSEEAVMGALTYSGGGA